jgi:hypothetical protein
VIALACQRFARTYAARSLTTPHGTRLDGALNCVVVWAREVLHGVASRPRIDGKDALTWMDEALLEVTP